MNPVSIIVNDRLIADLRELPGDLYSHLLEALAIPNLAKAQAKKMDEWGWQNLPDYVDLSREISANGHDYLSMPRGFLPTLFEGLQAAGYEPDLIDDTYFEQRLRIGTRVTPRPWQENQVQAILKYRQGIIKSPAGSGKTVAVLDAIQRLGCKALIIVNTKDILWQWQDRVRTFLGDNIPIGQIGDNTFDVSPYITIATAQTLHRRFDELETDGFFDNFTFVCLDECHHATAETYGKIMDRFSSKYRIGVSATPDKTGDFTLAQMILGPVIHDTKPSEVTTLLKPKIIRVPTKFGFHFQGQKNRWQRSNYPQMIEAIVNSADRNGQIIHCIMAEKGHHQLLVTKRLEHIAILEALLEQAEFPDPIVRVTGQDKNEDREAAVALLNSTPALMLSTLADEALDIPRLDRLHLVFPQKNTGLITQQVGRVERIHPDKTDALVFDYVDGNVGPLMKQWRGRRFEVYEPRGYKIEVRKVEP